MFNDVFERVWYIPEGSKNESEAFEVLHKAGIKPRIKAVYAETCRLEGYLLVFNCIPGVYHALKMACRGGNNRAPLEWVPGK